MSTSGSPEERATGSTSGGRPLDAAALEAIHHFSRVMIVRCGYETNAVDVAFSKAVEACRKDLPDSSSPDA